MLFSSAHAIEKKFIDVIVELCYYKVENFLERREIVVEKKYLGMDKNVCFGLGYLIPLLLIILLIADKELTTEEKQMCVACIFSCLAVTITCGLYWFVNLIAAIKCFGNDYSFKLFGCHQIATAIIK